MRTRDFETEVRRDVMVPMRDGVQLATDVYGADERRPRPVLIQRLPYGKDADQLVAATFDPYEAVARGYTVVVQDVRGCGVSEGEFVAFVAERDDGHDTIDWASRQPWCDGGVGIYGSSYMGVTALQASIDAPPSLKAVMAYLTGTDYHHGWVYSGGALELGFCLRWSIDQVGRLLDWQERTGSAGSDASAIRDVVTRFHSDPLGFVESSFDLRALAGAAARLMPHWDTWIARAEYDDYWAELDVCAAAQAGRVTAPVLQVAGWYDAFVTGQIRLHGLLNAARSCLVIGPWDHSAYGSAETLTTAGARDFGPQAAGGAPGVGPIALTWFDRWLRGREDVELPAVRYFMIGPDEWRSSATWPPPHALATWYLRSEGPANTRGGRGQLVRDLPERESCDEFLYDPASPAPTVGGRHLTHYVPSGVQEQSALEDRSDVLVYTSAPLEEPLAATGPVTLDLYVCSSAGGGDFMTTLVDVDPTGAAYNVSDGVTRLENTGPLGVVRRVSISLGEVAYQFGPGHRIRIHVTGSSFPRFDRNMSASTGNAADAPRAIRQHVLHSVRHPSTLRISVSVGDRDSPWT